MHTILNPKRVARFLSYLSGQPRRYGHAPYRPLFGGRGVPYPAKMASSVALIAGGVFVGRGVACMSNVGVTVGTGTEVPQPTPSNRAPSNMLSSLGANLIDPPFVNDQHGVFN